jgi:hypothetical protein
VTIKKAEEWTINYPIEINAETAEICSELKRFSGQGIEEYVLGAREFIQKIRKKQKLANEQEFLGFLDTEIGEEALFKLFNTACGALDIKYEICKDQGLKIVRSIEFPWKYYLEAISYLFFRRAYPIMGHGKKRVPGPQDLEQCVYLFWAGIFVTDDQPFLAFIKQLKFLRHYENEILDYEEFLRLL